MAFCLETMVCTNHNRRHLAKCEFTLWKIEINVTQFHPRVSILPLTFSAAQAPHHSRKQYPDVSAGLGLTAPIAAIKAAKFCHELLLRQGAVSPTRWLKQGRSTIL